MDALLQQLIFAVPAWIGAVVAVWGINTWRRQIRGDDEYQVARRLLLATYRYRDTLRSIRNPFSFATKEDEAEAAAISTSPTEKNWRLAQRRYDRRWAPVDVARSQLEAELLEAEVVWQESPRPAYLSLLEKEAQLFRAILEHIDSLEPSAVDEAEDRDEKRARRAILYCSPNNADQFSTELNAAIEGPENVLRKRLKKYK